MTPDLPAQGSAMVARESRLPALPQRDGRMASVNGGRPRVTRHVRIFAATPDQVGQARRFLSGLLGDHPGASDAVTCLSELAANACLHSASARPGGKFTVRVITGKDLGLRIEVSDAGGSWAARDHDDEWPHGLAIVAAIASDSGVSGDETVGRTAWATFRLT